MLSQIPAALTQDRKGTLSGPRSFACRRLRRGASTGAALAARGPGPQTGFAPGSLRQTPSQRAGDRHRVVSFMEPDVSFKSPSHLNL